MKYLIRTLIVIVILVVASPGIFYVVGINMVAGKPIPPNVEATYEEQSRIFKHIEKSSAKPKIEKMNPWGIAMMLIFRKQPQGGRIASLIARNHNQMHLEKKRMAYWHLSVASMAIWVSRNWSLEQMLTKVYELYGHELAPNKQTQLLPSVSTD